MPPLKKPANHQQIVAHYIRCRHPDLLAELAWFSQPQPLAKAIARAAAANGVNGKRLSHQWRLHWKLLDEAGQRLQTASRQINSAQNFDAIFQVVQNAVADIHGIGPLYVYDTAVRLGAYLGKSPDRVYLHAGARIGAKKLLRSPVLPVMPLTSFPAAYRGLPAHEMENLLCCYRDYF